MPSITSWNRIEPRPRTDSIARSLAAQIRDPLWILTRQWQFGEFQGEDAASPAWVRFRARFSRMDGWESPGGDSRHYDLNRSPLEVPVEKEPFEPDHAMAVELGQRFEVLLRRVFDEAAEGGAPALIDQFRSAHPLQPAAADDPDLQTRRFLRVCAGRVTDGIALLEATAGSQLPAKPVVPPGVRQDLVAQAIDRWRGWVGDVYGTPGRENPETWDGNRLAYRVKVSAATPGAGRARLDAHPGLEGDFEWFSFDESSLEVSGDEAVEDISRSLLPMQVRFRGMPHARWWQFQDRVADIGEIQPEMRELAKLVLMDFMFVHGNDWFVVPFVQEVGTLCRIDHLLVHDVFGGKTVIERSDRPVAGEDAIRRWSMFAITSHQAEGGLADYFILPPSAGASTLDGEVLESVRFLRDEMANMAWAVERTTENNIGRPWPGNERTAVHGADSTPATGTGTLAYRIQNTVPGHWIPFIPVQIDPSGEVALMRSAMLGPPDPETGIRPPVTPVGRILNQTAPYRVREEEVPRTGIDVTRIVRRTRWIDGSTHLWIARRKRTGGGEGSSGLRFDLLERTDSANR